METNSKTSLRPIKTESFSAVKFYNVVNKQFRPDWGNKIREMRKTSRHKKCHSTENEPDEDRFKVTGFFREK